MALGPGTRADAQGRDDSLMTFIAALTEKGAKVAAHRPWPRVVVDADTWRQAVLGIAAGEATLSSLWSDGEAVHMALVAEPATRLLVVSLPCPDKRFPSVAATHVPALRLERTIRDLYGLEPEGSPDTRPWLDHGRWGVRQPLGARTPDPAAGDAYAFLSAEGPPLHQIPVGPVHAGIIEPGHFRFSCNGEAVVRLEERLGYVHKGIDALMQGAPLDKAAKLAARVSGDSTVAYGIAFARAVEAALGLEPPPRAVFLRALMAELERLANHFGDIGAICNDASFSLMHAHCGILREHVLRVCRRRLRPPPDDGPRRARRRCGRSRPRRRRAPAHAGPHHPPPLPRADRALRQHGVAAEPHGHDRHPRATARAPARRRRLHRPGLGPLRRRPQGPGLRPLHGAELRGAGAPGGRRRCPRVGAHRRGQAVPGPDRADPRSPSRRPDPRRADIAPAGEAEGLAFAESFRGDILAWVRIAPDGRVAHCHLRDPSWFQWPLLEAAIEGNIVADFPLCNKSFNCSYSGHDI